MICGAGSWGLVLGDMHLLATWGHCCYADDATYFSSGLSYQNLGEPDLGEEVDLCTENQTTMRIGSVCPQKNETSLASSRGPECRWCVLEKTPLLGDWAPNCADWLPKP